MLDSLSVAPCGKRRNRGGRRQRRRLAGDSAGGCCFPKHFVLVDSNGKKTRFLFQAKLRLGLGNVSIEHCRIEDYHGPSDLVVCRALSTLAQCAVKTQHMLSGGAALLAMKGRHPGRELAELPSAFKAEFTERVLVPGASNRHVIGIRFRA